MVTSTFDETIERATEVGWTVHGVEEPRTFLNTPWVSSNRPPSKDGRIDRGLGSWDDGHYETVVLTVPTPSEVTEGLEHVLDTVPELTVDSGDGRPHVPRATVAENVFFPGRTIRAADFIADAEEARPEGE